MYMNVVSKSIQIFNTQLFILCLSFRFPFLPCHRQPLWMGYAYAIGMVLSSACQAHKENKSHSPKQSWSKLDDNLMRLQTFPGTILHMALIRSLLVTPVDSIIFDLAGLLDGSLLPRWLSVKSSEVANLHRSRIDTACLHVLHHGCIMLHAAQDRYAFEDGPHLDVLQQGACCAHAAHAQWGCSLCFVLAAVLLCLFRSSGVLCLFRISTLTVQICDRLCEYYPGQHLQRRSPQKNPSHRDVAAKRRSFLRTLRQFMTQPVELMRGQRRSPLCQTGGMGYLTQGLAPVRCEALKEK